MKIVKLLVFSLIALSFSGCTDELLDLKFNMPTMEVRYTIKAQTKAGEITLDPTVIQLNLDSLAKVNGTDLSKLKSCKAKKITIMIESPATVNFDKVISGELNISTGIIGDPDFDLIKIAEIKDIPKGARQFDITPADVDLLAFAKRPKFTLSGKTFTSDPYVEDIIIKVIIATEVIANPIKK